MRIEIRQVFPWKSKQKAVVEKFLLLGNVLAADDLSVSIRTSTGYLVEFKWDGTPMDCPFVLFSEPGCTGTPYLAVDKPAVNSLIHSHTAFWSSRTESCLVPASAVNYNSIAKYDVCERFYKVSSGT